MKRVLWGLCVSLVLVGCSGADKAKEKEADVSSPGTLSVLPLQDMAKAPKTMTLTSTDFKNGGALALRHSYDQFGCVGENVAPELSWSGAPKGTKSFALIVHDPDAPTGVGFFHWVLVNVPVTTTSLVKTLPAGALQLHTDYGKSGYGGPCPPKGRKHRYVFRVYALDVPKLALPVGATGALVRFMLRQHALAMGQIVGTFVR